MADMSIGERLTVYAIRRDHSRECGLFRVDVPEVGQRGLGFQIPLGPYVFGASFLTTKGTPQCEE